MFMASNTNNISYDQKLFRKNKNITAATAFSYIYL